MRDSVILNRRLATLFLLPAGLLLVTFLIVPAVWSLLQGLTNLTLLGPEALNTRFTGFQNYLKALSDPAFWNAFRVSAIYVIGSALIGQVVTGLALALLTHRLTGLISTVVRSLVILAWITPGVVVAILWNVFLNADDGTLNRVLGAAGLGTVNWLFERPILAIILYNIWRGTAFSMLLFDAALKTIPTTYYEAASVSGASGWRQFWDITFPLIRPQILTDMLLITLWTFNDFGPFLLTGGGPAYQTEVLPIYTYRVAFRSFELGYGAALSTMLLLINLALALVYLRALKRKP